MFKARMGLCLIALAATAAQAQVKEVAVAEGHLEGVVSDGISVFKGIPFAAPPVGPLRWVAPRPAARWSGTRKADQFAPSCMQDAAYSRPMGMPSAVSEDCLYLNVWTPAHAANERLPVMVWIYGGGFTIGSPAWPIYEGTKFAKKGVVLVNLSYRLGAFGFLATPELSREGGGGSGNFGLQDQIAGLRWIKANIARFGGDPSRVTIFGESAGGMSTSILAASPQAKGLFQRVISESGGSLATAQKGDFSRGGLVYSLDRAEARGASYLAKLGANSIRAARAMSAEKIQSGPEANTLAGFLPVLDGKVIAGDPYRRYRAGLFNDTPVLIGFNSDEGSMFGPPTMTPAQFVADVRRDYGNHADAILESYPHATDSEAAQSMKNIFRDMTFGWGTWTWAQLQAERKTNPAYVYYFDYRTPSTPNGSIHTAEVAFVFGNFGTVTANPTPTELKLSDQIQRYWVNFAATGNPNGSGLPNWPRFDSANQQVLRFEQEPLASPMPNVPQLRAMDGYFASLRAQASKRR